jgi:hypothetical protein
MRQGRPKLPTGQARTEKIPVRFSKAERRNYEKEAEEKGLTLSVWIRMACHEMVNHKRTKEAT